MYKRGKREGYGVASFARDGEERDVHWEMHCDWRLKRLYAGMAEREAGKALLKVKR